jgi:hypothetical protein
LVASAAGGFQESGDLAIATVEGDESARVEYQTHSGRAGALSRVAFHQPLGGLDLGFALRGPKCAPRNRQPVRGPPVEGGFWRPLRAWPETLWLAPLAAARVPPPNSKSNDTLIFSTPVSALLPAVQEAV